MTQQEFGEIRQFVTDKTEDDNVSIWTLLKELIEDIGPIFISKDYTYQPIKKWQLWKLYKLASAVYKFLKNLKRLN